VHGLADRRWVDRVADDVQDVDPVLEIPDELLPAPPTAAHDEQVEIEGVRSFRPFRRGRLGFPAESQAARIVPTFRRGALKHADAQLLHPCG